MGKGSKKVVIGYRYYLGFHFALCHGPVDFIDQILADKKIMFDGTLESGSANINLENLFGGDEKEGGVIALVEMLPGEAAQSPSGGIATVYPNLPGFRGVTTLFTKQAYVGTSPYLKAWSFRVKRIHNRQDGILQWYDAKSEIPGVAGEFVQSAAVQDLITGAQTNFAQGFIVSGSTIRNPEIHGSNYSFYRVPFTNFFTQPVSEITAMDFTVEVLTDQFTDCMRIALSDGGAGFLGWGHFNPRQSEAFDGLRRPRLAGSVLGTVSLMLLTAYRVELVFSVQNIAYKITRISDGFIHVAGNVNPGLTPPGVQSLEFVFDDDLPVTASSRFSAIHLTGVSPLGSSLDMNPAHILREILNDPEWGMGYPDAAIDEAAWVAAADTLYNEQFGLSMSWYRETTIEQLRNEVLRHINGELYVSRSSGQFVLKLIRDDYNPAGLILLDESNILQIDNFSAPLIGELTNSITINYYDRGRRNKGSLTLQDPALAQIQGNVINQKVDMPGITNFALAQRVAARELRALSTPLIACSIYTTRIASALNKGDVFKIVYPDFGVQELIMRVVTIDLGETADNRIKIQAVQDVFSMPDVEFMVPPEDSWVNPISPAPLPSDPRIVQEAPYLLLVQTVGQIEADSILALEPDAGYIAAGGSRPAADAVSAAFIVDAGAGYGSQFTLFDFCPYAILASSIAHLDAVVTSTNHRDIGFDPAGPIAPVLLPAIASIEGEAIQITAIDYNLSTNLVTLTIDRGIGDTVPVPHAAGSVLILWGGHVYGDEVQYVTTESLDVKILPFMGGAQLDPSNAPTDTVVMNSRAIRPYAPGNVQLETERYPVGQVFVGPLELTWAHRDRRLQTAAIIDQYAGNIGPEAGTTYTIRIYDGALILTDEITGLAGTSELIFPPGSSSSSSADYADDARIELLSVRDGYESWQAHRLDFFWIDMPGASSSSSSSSSSSNLSWDDLILVAGPAAWYKMHESGGTAMVDAIAGNNGTYLNAPVLQQPGFIPGGTKAVDFPGDNQSATVPNLSGFFPGTGEYAIEMVCSFDNTNQSHLFYYGEITSSPFRAVQLQNNSDGTSVVPGLIHVRDSDVAGHGVSSVQGKLNDGHHRHYVCQRRNVSGTWQLQIYINGVLDNSISLAAPENIVDSGGFAGLVFGRIGANQISAGFCDELVYYVGKSLTTTEISDHAAVVSPTPSFTTGAYQSAVLASGPTSYWSLDELSRTWIHDRVNGYNGRTGNSPTLGVTPHIATGKAITFNGTSQYIEVPHFVAHNPGTGEYAIEMWSKFTSTTTGIAFAKILTSGSFDGPTVFFNFDGSAQVAGKICLRDKSGAGFFVTAATTGLNDGTWRHYVFQRRNTSGATFKLQIYINGTLNAETTLGTVTNLGNSNVTWLCSRNGLQWIAGTFDEVAYYVGKSLTSTEIGDHFAAA